MFKRPIVCKDTGESCDTYKEYLHSKHWKAMKKRMFKIKTNHFCFICKTPESLHIHHKTYENLGNEHTSELMYLCSCCHKSVHERLNTPTYKNEKLYNVARIIRREYLGIRKV